MAGPGRPLTPIVQTDPHPADALKDPAKTLRQQVIADRFEVLDDPLGWRCRGCEAVVQPAVAAEDGPDQNTVNRLAESAADHALYCGRCDD